MLRMRPARRRRSAPQYRRSLDILLGVAILAALLLVAARLDRVARIDLKGAGSVIDGDTVMLGGERIRLLGLDAPELGQSCSRQGQDYACGREARNALIGLIEGKAVSCAGWERDRYGRLLASCRADGVDINRQLVANGWAVAYGDFEAEERAARQHGAGLWAGSFDRPRAWRDRHGSLAESGHGGINRLVNWLRQILRFS